MKKFLSNAGHVVEAMSDGDIEMAELEFEELSISFNQWKLQQKRKNFNIKKGSAPTLPINQAIAKYTRL